MLARSPVLFVIARGLQGLSGAAVWVAGLALVVDTVAEDRVGEAMGYTTMGMSVGSLLGPAAGGVLYDKLGFYGAFYVPIALIVLDIVLRLVMIEPNGMAVSFLLSFNSFHGWAAYSKSQLRGSGRRKEAMSIHRYFSPRNPLLLTVQVTQRKRSSYFISWANDVYL